MGRVTIIGGGLGGLTTALALRRLGMEAEVYERAPAFEVVGSGLTITPGVRKALNYLEFHDAFEQAVEAPERPSLLDWGTGAPLAEPEPRTPHLDDVRRIRRSDFHDLLMDALRSVGGCKVHFGHRLIKVRQDETSATAVFENGQVVDAELLVGADGIRSAVRPFLTGPETPRFTGYVAWRFMIPTAAAARFLQGRRIMITAGPSASLTCYSVDHGETLNCVAIVNGVDEGEGGWGARGESSELTAQFASANEDARGIVALAPRDGLFKWVLYDRPPLERWTDRRIALLGDAAHPILPFLGSGAGLAIEDGVVLARCLQAAFEPESLVRYQHARVERTNAVQKASTLQGRLFGLSKDGKAASGSPFFDDQFFTYDPVTAPI
jgi:salicylate hydroxylase